MTNKFLSLLTLAVFSFFYVSEQETINVLICDELKHPLEEPVPNRINDCFIVLYDYQPDFLLVCEPNNITGSTAVLNTSKSAINNNFKRTTNESNTSNYFGINQYDLQNSLYYDSPKLILKAEFIIPTDLRDFNVYTIKLNTNGQATNPITLYKIVCHLKASCGSQNAIHRFEMVVELKNYLHTLPSNRNMLLASDLNVYKASKATFQELLDRYNNITFTDFAIRVISWSNNTSCFNVFTQSTRTQFGFSTKGRFDDRLDSIVASENIISFSYLRYAIDSYKVFVNNGLTVCYNRAVSSLHCQTKGFKPQFDISNTLHNFSDHPPVKVLLELTDNVLNTQGYERITLTHLDTTIIDQNLAVNADTKPYFDVSDLQIGPFFLNTANSNSNPIKFITSN